MSRTQSAAVARVIEEIESREDRPEDQPEEDQPEDDQAEDDQPEEEVSEDEEGEDGFEEDDDYFDLAQLSQLLVTEEGEPLADVLKGIRDALDKHNKILFRLVSTVDKLASK